MTNINLKKMKEAAFKLPDPVRSLILGEPDKMDFAEFLTKVGTWDRLLKIHEGAEK